MLSRPFRVKYSNCKVLKHAEYNIHQFVVKLFIISITFKKYVNDMEVHMKREN